MRTAVVLFTRDLRVRDQAALRAAADAAEAVVPLFVFDDTLLHRSSARESFLLESLADLRRSLRELGGDLVVRTGDAVDETLRVVSETDADALFIGEDVSPYARRRQQALEGACRAERVELRVESTIAAVPPGELVPHDRDHYRVFTPYWRRWRDASLPAPLESPRRIRVPTEIASGDLRTPSTNLRGGEQAGRQRLDIWLRGGLHEYENTRDDLDMDGTSRLSPYLHAGCVSANEVVTRARREGSVAEAYVRQLCWRDFYLQLLAANPRTVTGDLYERDAGWSDDESAFTAWADGRTGFPIVDAAMRQLRAEGWMHNRARLLASSFLTKTLGIDWRLGADVFFELLVDGDVANNVGNWQWMAGTGVDARRNRRFNPIAQAKRLDRNGDYVGRYVPELSHLPGAAVHEPWRAPRASRPPEYPDRIVDHAR